MIKYNSVLLIALLFAGNIAAQSKNPTSNKEVQDKIKQAQQQFDKLTPEQKNDGANGYVNQCTFNARRSYGCTNWPGCRW